jgi:hypothetical protein
MVSEEETQVLNTNKNIVCLMVFNNISVISWRSVLLVEENLSHNVVHLTLIEIRTDNISGDRH